MPIKETEWTLMVKVVLMQMMCRIKMYMIACCVIMF